MVQSHTVSGQTLAAPADTRQRWHYFWLLLIILLGAALRFYQLDEPAIWGDEAATWARTCGTFEELLKDNRDDGFMPLHYELYWLMGKCWQLTPWRMRLAPALAGTAMAPAMYFLARQLIGRKRALIAALFAATSAYFLYYSRDAKMYMQTWLFATLHLGCVIWWLRGGGGLAWWSWVASGVAAAGLHSAAWLVAPIGLLALLTSGRPGLWRPILYLLGVAIMAVGPYFFYARYNTWADNTGGLAPTTQRATNGRPVNWMASGIGWIDQQPRAKSGPALVSDSATAFLFSYSRAEEYHDRLTGVSIPQNVLHSAGGTLTAIVLVLLAGAVKWPGQKVIDEPPPWRSWQVALWQAVWLIVPAYAVFYCRSVSQPLSAWDCVSAVAGFIGLHWLWAIPLASCLAYVVVRDRRAEKWTAWGLGAVLAVMCAISVILAWPLWYLTITDCASPAVVAVFAALAGAVSFAASGTDWRGRLSKLLQVVIIVAVVLTICQIAWLTWDALRQSAGAVAQKWKPIWMPRYLGAVAPCVLIVLAIAISRLPGRWLRAALIAGFVAINLLQYGARLALDPEPRVDQVAADVCAADSDEQLVVAVRDHGGMRGSPGLGSIRDIVGKYYIAQYQGGSYSPASVKNRPVDQMLSRPLLRLYRPSQISGFLRGRPNARRLVIWDEHSGPDAIDVAQITKAIGPDWQLVSDRQQQARRHWNWQNTLYLRRVEFRRPGASEE